MLRNIKESPHDAPYWAVQLPPLGSLRSRPEIQHLDGCRTMEKMRLFVWSPVLFFPGLWDNMPSVGVCWCWTRYPTKKHRWFKTILGLRAMCLAKVGLDWAWLWVWKWTDFWKITQIYPKHDFRLFRENLHFSHKSWLFWNGWIKAAFPGLRYIYT